MTPISWFTNKAAYGFLRLFGVKPVSESGQAMSPDELRSVVAEAGPMIPTRHRQMLLSILDLEHVTVNDIMVPRQDIASINVDDNWEDILDQLRQTPHTRLPLHEGELDNLVGIVHMKRVAQELARDTLTRERLVELARAREPYFVPEGTSLTVQLNQFQRNRRRMAFVVDEYGDIQGFVTLEDILEEIVGEFTTDPATVTHKHVHREAPGVFIINASATIRALNRSLGWQLPTDGPEDTQRAAGRATRDAARGRRGSRRSASTSSKCCRSARTPSAPCARAAQRDARPRPDRLSPARLSAPRRCAAARAPAALRSECAARCPSGSAPS